MHAMSARRPRIFDRFPQAAGRLPWVSLGTTATPVQRLELGGAAGTETWVKRDDLTAVPYGGNKVRKLEFLLAEARRQGATRVITIGAAGSHHALATTIYCHRMGIPVSLVLFPEPVTPEVVTTLCIEQALGAELRFTRRMETVPLAIVAARAAHRGERPVVIPPGGSSPTGALGYVDAALEIAEQVEAGLCPSPRAVYVAGGTLGTAVGLAVGLALAGLGATVKAVRVTGSIVANERVLRKLVRRTLELLAGAGVPTPAEGEVCRRVELLHDYLGAGYAAETEEGRVATRTFAAAGLQLEKTYTAKAAAAFLAAARAGEPGPLLYVHTISATLPAELAGETGPDALPEPFRRYLELRRAPA